MKLTLGFSPCPNDTFIFDALVTNKIDTGGLEFEPVLADVQTLNNWAAEGKLVFTKLSFPALFEQASHYKILMAGAALGRGVGPLLVAKKMVDVRNIASCRVAIPGENTTANFLMSYVFPQAVNKTAMLFSGIEEAVLSGAADLGVIIHENRFTYKEKGLHKICDLGEIWEKREGLPIPLGCIAAKRNLPPEVTGKVDALIAQSVQHALAAYPQLPPYVIQHAQAMDEAVMRKHIDLYVNTYSINLGEEGRQAVEKLYEVFCRQHNQTKPAATLFN